MRKEIKHIDTSKLAVSIRKLEKSFGDNHVLRKIDLDVYQGENLVVLGRSGTGKSVLIKIIAGLLKPDAGQVTVLGEDVAALDLKQLRALRLKIGFSFQNSALYDSMTVRENLEFPLRRHWIKLSKDTVNERVEDALQSVGLSHTIDMMPAELSGGMRKRIALARTLILKPEIILYDEPTTGLDPITGKEIIQLMTDIQKTYQTTSLIISHDMNCVRMAGNRVVILIDGRCYADGTYDELLRNDDPKIKQFFE